MNLLRWVVEMSDRYDAGYLNDFGGGNIEWWQDYIRAELGRSHDFYSEIIREMVLQTLSDAGQMADLQDEVERLRDRVAEYKSILSRD